MTSLATDGSAVPFCVSQTNISTRNVRIRWSPHLVALEEGLTTGPSHFSLLASEAHSLTTASCWAFSSPTPAVTFPWKADGCHVHSDSLALGTDELLSDHARDLQSSPSTQTPGFSLGPLPLLCALLRSPADPLASTSALLVQSLLLASTPTPRLQEAPAFSSWVRMKMAGH